MNGLMIALDRRYPAAAKRLICAYCGGAFPEAWQPFFNPEGQRVCSQFCKPSALCECSCHKGNTIGSHAVACCAAPAAGVMGTSTTLAEWFAMTPADADRAAELARGVEAKYPPTLAEFAKMIEEAVTPRQKKTAEPKGKAVPTKTPRRAKSTKDVSMIATSEEVVPAVAAADPPAAPAEGPPPEATPSAPAAVDAKEAKFRRAVALLGALFVARKDVYAIEHRGTWMPAREDMRDAESACLKMTGKAFREHFFGDVCMGTYLLDTTDAVKFIAFDCDLRKDALYFPVRDSEELEAFIAANGSDTVAINGILEMEAATGNLEASLHDAEHPAHRWARIMLDATMKRIAGGVRDTLGLEPINVVTGGGGHVLVPFGQLIMASEARLMARSVMEAVEYEPLRGENFWTVGGEQPAVEIEVFPKQDSLPANGFGNLIRLPLGKHHRTGKRSYFTHAGPYDLPGSRPWDLPRLDSIAVLEAAATALSLEV